MQIKASTVAEYVTAVPEERQKAFKKLRSTIRKNIPKGFKEELNYGMIGYVVPKSVYPPGYHTTPDQPLPFVNIGNQKGFIGLYHMGIYSDPKLLKWFTTEWPKHAKYKLDMGKSCIRLKKIDDIPFELIGELMTKMTSDQWIKAYEKSRPKPKGTKKK